MEIETFVEIDRLYTVYQSLLTEKQRQVMEYYYQEDYSLTEISDLMKVSRQAVHDNIKRTQAQLYDYEERLHLLKKLEHTQELQNLLEEVTKQLEKQNPQELKSLVEKMKQECEGLSE